MPWDRRPHLRAVVVLAVLAFVAAGGCGGGGGGGGGGGTKSVGSVTDYVQRILKGESPSAVVGEAASRFGEAFARQVRQRAAAAEAAYDDFRSSDTKTAACATLDFVNQNGGLTDVSEADIVEFAQGQFSRYGQAQEFAENLKKLTDVDLSVVPSLWCTGTSGGG
jgi:hypothetical protein